MRPKRIRFRCPADTPNVREDTQRIHDPETSPQRTPINPPTNPLPASVHTVAA